MASSISAGTTSSTALVATADTTGALVLQTNNGTTALTLSTAQNATFAGTLATASRGIAAASMPAGSIVQVATYNTGAVATGTGTIPLDDTIPQITEGTEFMTLAITPTSATSKLIITVCLQLDKNNSNTYSIALFQDSTANALAAQFNGAWGAGSSFPMVFTHTMTSGTTSSTTFRVRAGSDSAGTLTVNGRGGGRIYGGVSASSIVIYEVAA